jgi:hypothetical protein
LSQIQSVTISLVLPTVKKRFPFIPRLGNTEKVQISKTFTSKKQMMEDLETVLSALGEVWDDEE